MPAPITILSYILLVDVVYLAICVENCRIVVKYVAGADPGGGARGPGTPPLTTKNEAPAPKFYKTEAPEWQF